MDRTQRLTRRLYVFVGALVVGVVVLVLRAATTTELPAAKALPPTFPGIDVAKVRAVEVEKTVTVDGKPTPRVVRLERTGVASWAVASSDGYAADAKKVEDFVKSLAEVRTKGEVSATPEKFPTFAGPDGWTNVRLFGDGEAPTLSFGLGKGNALGSWSNTFVRVDDLSRRAAALPGAADAKAGRIVGATGIDGYTDRTDVTQWIEGRLFPGLTDGEIVEVTWSHPSKGYTGRLVRGTKGEKDAEDPWLVEVAGPAAPAKADAAKQVVSALTGVRLASLEGRAADGSDATYGFDRPDVVVTATAKPVKDGVPAPIYKLEIGKKLEGKSTWYVRRSMLKGADPWVYAVNEYELAKFRDDPKDLLVTPPTPPAPPAEPAMADAPPAMTDGPAAMGEAPPAEPAMTDAPPAMTDAPPAPAAGPEAPPAPPAMDGAGAPETPAPPK
ncbi:MAG: DUF4340 domain-containing protein [Planctomycetia bacterium]|nr:DUF4340 domain-containing protein [Planctomycetia bacterium]